MSNTGKWDVGNECRKEKGRGNGKGKEKKEGRADGREMEEKR